MNQLQVVEQKLVPFGDSEILAVKTSDGKICAAVSWVCKGIGLTEKQKDGQVSKVQSDLVLNKGYKKLSLKFEGQVREVVCIELDFLPLWLAKISITPAMQETNPEAVENLVNYQLKAKDVLAEAFLPKERISPFDNLSPQLQTLIHIEMEQNKIKEQINQVKSEVQGIREVVAINTRNWRKDTNAILNKIAQQRGGFDAYQQVRQESYGLLEDRAKCKLSIRLTNMKRQMLENGQSKSKVDKVSKLDVIDRDTRLLEIYTAIVKEMAIANKIDVEGLGA